MKKRRLSQNEEAIRGIYSKVDKVGFDEVKILEGDEKYGK